MSEIAAAKEAAKRLFKKVSYQDGPLGSYELTSLLSNTYDILKIRKFLKNLSIQTHTK